jgi:hypothetical protein
MRKLAGILLALTLVGSMATSALAADQYTPERVPMAKDNSQIMMMITEEGLVDNQTHFGVPPMRNATHDNKNWIFCDKSTDKACDYLAGDRELDSQSVIPVCSQSKSAVCIEGLELANSSADFTDAKYVRTATGGPRVIADPNHNLLEGTSSSIFDAPSVPSLSGTTKYSVIVTLKQHYQPSSKMFTTYSMNASVIAVRDDEDPSYGKIAADGNGAGATNMCAYWDVGHCGIPQDFVEGTRIRLNVRIPSELGGWFRGRIKNPAIDVEGSPERTNFVSIEGEPLTVSRFALPIAQSSLTDADKSLIERLGSWGTPVGGATGTNGSRREAMTIIEKYRAVLKDSATGISSFWSMGTTEGGNGSPCLSDTSKVLGVVTTNSMAYDGSAPSFSNGSLNYKVAGLHFMPDGKAEVEGSYDLVMRSETARCLYGFNKAPISAKISVTSASGEAKVATTVMSEKNGWVKLAAYGFTFSSPTISVKLTQEGSAPAPTAKRTTITCAKGKLTKKITAVGPKCPAGYKKK